MYAVANMLRGVVGPISEQARTYLEMLQGDCLRLLTTVNDILDLRKLEAGTLELKRVKAPVVPLIRRAVESLALQARQKSVALTTEYAGGPWFVHGDAQKLERVLLNVVGNAIKFTPEGGGVQVVADAPPNDAGEVRIRVTDTGVGIPADAISKVTLRYFTVGQQPSGSGLGLAISKEIIALHRGELEIESPAPGQSGGTQVTVLLPRVQAPLVLVVDDDEAVCNVLQRQVAAQGYRVAGALEGTGALHSMQKEQPDYLVLDVALPGLDGIELILRMQGEERLKRVPAVVVTGVPLSEARQQILKTLGVRLLPKPWDEEQLRLSLENYALGAHPSGEGAGVS